MSDQAAIEAEIVRHCRAGIPGLTGVLLYGSRVDPTNPSIREDSDWDVALLFAEGGDRDDDAEGRAFAKTQFELWGKVGQVNLVRPFRAESDFLLFEILRNHRVLWRRDDDAYLDFVVRANRIAQEGHLRAELERRMTSRVEA